MKFHLTYLTVLFFTLSLLLQNCIRAEGITSTYIDSSVDKFSTKKVETGALMWSDMILKPEYDLPVGAGYNLRPRMEGRECDMLEVKYNVDIGDVSVIQTRSIFAFHIQFVGEKRKDITVSRVEAIAKRAFENSEDISLSDQGYIKYDKEIPAWLLTARWFYSSGSLTFFMLKDQSKEPYQSQQIKSYSLMDNYYWFTKWDGKFPTTSKQQSSNRDGGIQLIMQVLTDSSVDSEKRISGRVTEYINKVLAALYAPPAQLLYGLPLNDIDGGNTLKMRYTSGLTGTDARYQRPISLAQTPLELRITVDPSFTNITDELRAISGLKPLNDFVAAKFPLTLKQIEDLSKEMFRHDGDIVGDALVATAENPAPNENQLLTQGTITLRRKREEPYIQYSWTQSKEGISFSVPIFPKVIDPTE